VPLLDEGENTAESHQTSHGGKQLKRLKVFEVGGTGRGHKDFHTKIHNPIMGRKEKVLGGGDVPFTSCKIPKGRISETPVLFEKKLNR